MGLRLELQALLEEILGTRHVYFQPPSTVEMSYPAIVYMRDVIDTKFANDNPYTHTKRYAVTLIDRDPDSPVVDKLLELPMTVFNRHYVANNLNHDVFNVYF